MSDVQTKGPAEEVEIEIDEKKAARAQAGIYLACAVLTIGAAGFLYWHYSSKEKPEEKVVFAPEAPLAPPTASFALPKIPFTDVTAAWGLTFMHVTGARGDRLLPETMGAGAAFLDYDNDGDPDLFMVQSATWPGDPNPSKETQRLFRNDGDRFTDVTKEAGLDSVFYGQGVAAGDFDEDGFVDLYVTAVGPNRLFKNVGGKRFTDVTEASGAGGGDHWSSSAAFLDYDQDGRLDLFVANYVKWSKTIDLSQSFKLTGLGRAYGPPTGFEGDFPLLFRNLGGGKFEEVGERAGIHVKNRATGVPVGKSLGVSVTDFNDDGRPDLLVANDTVQNFAFENRGDGTFAEVAKDISIAFDEKGNSRGAMGIDAGDFRNDGTFAVCVGNFANEMDAFFVSEKKGDPTFIDLAAVLGIGAASRASLTFGVIFADFDLDGRLDYVTANGHVEPEIRRVQESQRHEQSAEFFWSAGAAAPREFMMLGKTELGADFVKPIVGRGLLTADIDGDGDLDILITTNGGAPLLLRNDAAGAKSLRLDLRTKSGRTAIGAEVQADTPAGRQRRFIGGASSYLSYSEPIATIGLGTAAAATGIVIRWPDGKVQKLDRLEAGRQKIVEP